MFIAGQQVPDTGELFHAVNPATGEKLQPGFASATAAQVAAACTAAAGAAREFRELPLAQRAQFLEEIARRLVDLGDTLCERVTLETALPLARTRGERDRTVFQLRLFAQTVRQGAWLDARIDPGLPERKPLPRPDLRLQKIPLGPVAVFGASNFPLAFSVAGGDTASALAAGCPVIVKGHPAHPGTSAMVAKAIVDAAAATGMPAGVFALLQDHGHSVGGALVSHPSVRAVAFTGSRKGGLALWQRVMQRPEPVPFYAEMSSINPVILFPGAIAARITEIAEAFIASLTLGVGQFCTNPGLVLVLDCPEVDALIQHAAKTLAAAPPASMLTSGICAAYDEQLERFATCKDARLLAQGGNAERAGQARASLWEASAEAFLRTPLLGSEVFGPSGLLVRCRSVDQLIEVLESLEGQLTIALHVAESDHASAKAVLPIAQEKAGRILFNGFGTGVEVCHAMVHGGPWPATTDARSTSVGTLAIDRFLRPVSYQNFPPELLPAALQDGNPLGIPRRVDGKAEPL